MSSEYSFNPKTISRKKFTAEEDRLLIKLIESFGEENWEEICIRMKARNGRQCRDRWISCLSPIANKMPWSDEEDQRIIDMVKDFGPKWSIISTYFDQRTDSMIKNRYAVLMRKLAKKERPHSKSVIVENKTNLPDCSDDFLEKIYSSALFESEENNMFWFL